LLFSPFYGTVIALKFIDLNEFTTNNMEKYKRYLLDTIMLSNRDAAKTGKHISGSLACSLTVSVSTLHAAFATSFYAKTVTTDKDIGTKLTNMSRYSALFLIKYTAYSCSLASAYSAGHTKC